MHAATGITGLRRLEGGPAGYLPAGRAGANGPRHPGQPRCADLAGTPLGREASRLNPGRTVRRLPSGRQATPWEVAYATVWLLSGESSYVNAHPLVLDGGTTSFG
jgi:NAD(P)-dependent dehydrogenase (short-subunit alcohol dehydrogenase family)